MEIAPRSTAGRKRVDLTQAKLRSAITNGSSILANCDYRSAPMRRLKDLISAHEAQLANDVSEAEGRLIRRAAMLTLQLELLDTRFAANDGSASERDLDLYIRASGNLRRLLESLGLGNRMRDVTPPDPLVYAGEAAG